MLLHAEQYMATQRAGKGSPEERENGVIDAKIAEGSAIRGVFSRHTVR